MFIPRSQIYHHLNETKLYKTCYLTKNNHKFSAYQKLRTPTLSHRLRTSQSTIPKMKFSTTTTLLFATLSLASPAPLAQPAATAALAPASLAPEVDARAASLRLDTRDPKSNKPKTGSNNNNNTNETENASSLLAPSRVLELGALGLGVMEIVRLWG
jgi:hypothetical protein